MSAAEARAQLVAVATQIYGSRVGWRFSGASVAQQLRKCAQALLAHDSTTQWDLLLQPFAAAEGRSSTRSAWLATMWALSLVLAAADLKKGGVARCPEAMAATKALLDVHRELISAWRHPSISMGLFSAATTLKNAELLQANSV